MPSNGISQVSIYLSDLEEIGKQETSVLWYLIVDRTERGTIMLLSSKLTETSIYDTNNWDTAKYIGSRPC